MPDRVRRVAILPWGNVIEDFLATLGTTLDEFCESMQGSWMFSYALALRTAGIETTFVLFSRDVTSTELRHHRPTHAPVVVMPAAAAYRIGRALTDRPRPRSRHETDDASDPPAADARPPGRSARRSAAAYLSTPGLRFWKVIRAHGCDAVLSQEYEYARFDVLAAGSLWSGIPLFASFQGGSRPPTSSVGLRVRTWSMRRASGLIVGAELEAQRIESLYRIRPERIGRIPNPVALPLRVPDTRSGVRTSLGIPAEAPLVLWHGRVDFETKGLDLLLDAWQRIEREFTSEGNTSPWLLLVGNGPDGDRLRKVLAAGGLSRIRWIDRFIHDRDEVFALLASGSVYAFPSRREGFPIAPIEAMGCGLPVVAAEASGVREILPDGEASGGVVVPIDDAESIAAQLGRFIRDPELARSVGCTARTRAVSAFSLEAVGERLAAFLDQNAS